MHNIYSDVIDIIPISEIKIGDIMVIRKDVYVTPIISLYTCKNIIKGNYVFHDLFSTSIIYFPTKERSHMLECNDCRIYIEGRYNNINHIRKLKLDKLLKNEN